MSRSGSWRDPGFELKPRSEPIAVIGSVTSYWFCRSTTPLCRSRLLVHLPVEDHSLRALGDHQRVAKLHFLSGLAADQHVDVRIVHAKDLRTAVHEEFSNHSFVGLLDHGGYLRAHQVDSCNDLARLSVAVRGALSARFQPVAVAFGVVGDRLEQGLHISQH